MLPSPAAAKDRGEHVAGLHRGQLVGVAEQHQLRAVGHRFGQLAHQWQVDHRRLVDHDDVVRQRVVGVVAELRRIGDDAEQAVQGRGPGRQRMGKRGGGQHVRHAGGNGGGQGIGTAGKTGAGERGGGWIAGEAGCGKRATVVGKTGAHVCGGDGGTGDDVGFAGAGRRGPRGGVHHVDRATQALGHALGGTAGGRGQRDPRRGGAGLRGGGDAQDQHARDGGGLAGAGAAGDQQQRATQGECGGTGLAVVRGGGRKQLLEQRCEHGEVERRHPGAAGAQRLCGDPAQARGQAAFVLAVAAQVEQAAFEDQRLGLGDVIGVAGRGDPARSGEYLAPAPRVGPRHCRIDQPPRLRRIEAGVALRHRQRGQRGGGQHFVGRVRIEPAQALRQRIVERAQRPGLDEFAQQAHAATPSAP
ncbi:hypothetical protein H1235_00335 [Pseudoxanthomonas sp. NC8]|nr:hypothetical protein H1235_00335 [Pseudoxanthomonas sp. NC8]